MSDAIRERLAEAREDFVRLGDHASAGALLEAAYDAWNESSFSERDYVEEVQSIQRWLARLGASESRPAHGRAA